MEESKEVIVQECELTEMISINVICRLCANQNDKLIGIYSEDGINNDLANKMNMYLPVKVAETDDLPLQCCWQCASTVLAWHDLVLSSVEADRRLRNCEFITTKVVSQDEDEQMDAASDTTIQEDCEADLSLEETVTEELVESSSTLNAFCQNDIPEIIPTSDGTFIEQKEDISPVPLEDGEGDDDTKYIIDNAEINIKEEENSKCTKGDSSETTTMFCCEVCPMVFAIEEDIIKHIDDRHTNENGDYVKKEVSMTQDSRKERRRNTKIDQDLVNAAKVVVDNRVYYNCKECGKSLHSPYTYVWHMRIHTGERPFVCDLCGKQFRVSQGLVRHLKETHQRIKNFACDLCGRMFATRRNVEEHRRIHTNERPYICDLCGKAFKQKASLFVHNRSHSDHYPYQCTYCSQAFRTKPPLLIHITKHTGEKPYPCDICGRRFRIKYELKRHRLIHFDEKPFSCEDCGVSFRQKRYLRNHNKLNHQ